MGVLNLLFSRKYINTIEDYGEIFNSVLDMNIPIIIQKFSRTEYGIEMRISVPDEKLSEFIKTIKSRPGIGLRQSAIEINEDLCVDCGECISLCSTGALYFDEDYKRQFDKKKCVACRICLDACPRCALGYKFGEEMEHS